MAFSRIAKKERKWLGKVGRKLHVEYSDIFQLKHGTLRGYSEGLSFSFHLFYRKCKVMVRRQAGNTAYRRGPQLLVSGSKNNA